jgi:hypothetical protein
VRFFRAPLSRKSLGGSPMLDLHLTASAVHPSHQDYTSI